jgi:aldose 1-epimerase
LADVTLGFDTLKPYLTNPPYFGAIIGRYGNRIAKGQFSLDGQTYHLYINNGPNSLHGGQVGFNKVLWDASPIQSNGEVGLSLHYSSPDGEEGYPGNLDVTVTYTLTNNNVIRIVYDATTDADTVVNLTNHAYWNLSGQGNGKILGTWMQIPANFFTPTDSTQIPTGEIRSVSLTPFDFRKPAPLGWRINAKDNQIKIGAGYDHNWILSKPFGTFGLAAQATDPVSGRVLSVYTDQPAVQLYTGNFLEGVPAGKGGVIYHKNYGFALETQHYPDSPNHANFPSTELKPGQKYHTVTEYRFTTTSAMPKTRYVYKWVRKWGRLMRMRVAVVTPVPVISAAPGVQPAYKWVRWHGRLHKIWLKPATVPTATTVTTAIPAVKPAYHWVRWHGRLYKVRNKSYSQHWIKPVPAALPVTQPQTITPAVKTVSKWHKHHRYFGHRYRQNFHTGRGHWIWVPDYPTKPAPPSMPVISKPVFKKPGS